MSSIFGATVWARRYGDNPTEEWRHGLGRMTAAQIVTGIETCIKLGLEWPPSLPSFALYCHSEDQLPPGSHSGSKPSAGLQNGLKRLLDHSKPDSRVAQAEMQKIRDIISGKGVDLSQNPRLAQYSPADTSAHAKFLAEDKF